MGVTVAIAGIQGPPGTSVRHGVGAPASSLGLNGDFYLDVTVPTALVMYGPKSSGAWGSGVAMGGGSGVQIGGDLGGTNTAPTVTSTHLSSALPILQGGTGGTTQAGARTALGLGTAAIADSSAFDASGAAGTAQTNAATYTDGKITAEVARANTAYPTKANNLSDLGSAPTARTNLGLGGSATLGVGTATGTVAAGDDSRITGAAQKSANLGDLTLPGTARTNLGLGGAAVLSVGTSAGTVAAGDDGRITGAAQKAANLSDLGSPATSRTNLGLGGAAVLAVGTTTGTVAAGDDSRITAAIQTGQAAGGDLTGSTLPNPVLSRINGAAISGSVAAGKALIGTDATHLSWSETDGIGPWIYNVMARGAKADGQQVHDGAMLSGSAVLTSPTAAFTVNDVNKVIQVKYAGTANSTTLVTTILSFQSATQVTLASANASGSNKTNLQFLWGTDDTAAINTAVGLAFTHAQNTGGLAKVFFPVPVNPNGFYAIGGPLLHTASGNAQIPVPLQPTTANKITIIFEGAGNSSGFQHWQQTTVQTGVTLVSFGVYASSGAQSTDINANGNPSVIGGPTVPNGYGVSPGIFTNVLPVLRNLSIRNAHNANGYGWTAWDFYGCAEANVENILYGSTGNVVDGDFNSPGTFGSGSSIGMLMPAPGNNDNSRAQNIACQGGYTFGAFLPEHFVTDRISILYCWAGLCPVGTYGGSVGSTHAINIGQASIEACSNTVCVIGSGSGGQGPWLYGVLDAEGTISFIDRFGTSGNGLAALLGQVQLVGIVNPATVSLQSPTGLSIINGMQGYNSKTVSSSYAVSVMDQTVYVDASAGAVSITLISAQWTPNTYTVKKIDSSANPVNVLTAGGQTIDGLSTYVLSAPNQAATFAPQGGIGTHWYVV